MRNAKASLVATLGIGMIVIAGSIGCGGASTAPAAAAPVPAAGTGGKTPASMMDSDNDGVMDDVDMCPNEKEDGKGSAPGDGCPDGKGASAKSA